MMMSWIMLFVLLCYSNCCYGYYGGITSSIKLNHFGSISKIHNIHCNYLSSSLTTSTSSSSSVSLLSKESKVSLLYANKQDDEIVKEPTAFDQVASKGLAGVLAIALAEAIFWALGMPLATLWVKFTTGEWIDLMTTEGQLQAAGFTFGYGGFATVILQYRVTLFAIPLVPLMEKLVVEPGKKFFGDKFGEKNDSS